MTGDLRFDWYDWAGGREAMLRFGPDEGPVVITALPLFEEANRTRAFMVSILRALAARGIGSVLPDVPGQGESLVPLEMVSLGDMRAAFAAASRCFGERRFHFVAIRSGALLDRDAAVSGHWHLSPQDGQALVRELSRIEWAGSNGGAGQRDGAVEIGGNSLSAALLRDLGEASLSAADRTVRLTSDPAPADCKFDAPALWRRSEPSNDPVFAETLADDIARWIATCGD